MHLAILAAVVLAQVPLPVPFPGGAQDDYQSPIVSLVAWDKGGSQDWGAGIPSPTIDCAAVGTSSAAALQCSGATPSFAGPGQVAAGSPWWHRNDTAVLPSIVLNGSTDYWTLGNQPTCGDKQTILFEFTPTTISGAEYLFGIDDRATKRDFALYRNAGALVPTWFKSGGYTEQAVTGIIAGSAFVFAASYDASGGDGAGVLRANLNGTAPAPVTTGVAPLRNLTDQPMGIGASIGGSPLPSSSKIRRAARWCGWAGSASELAQLVATQWGLAADKPAGTVATHARTDSTLCCPFSDAECYWVGPGAPCIHAPTYQGWASGGAVAGGVEVYGPGANALGYSETFANAVWVKSAGVTAADASASCPMSPLAGTRMSLVTTDGEADQIAQDAATTPGRAVWLARATGDSACGVTFGDATGDGAQSVALTDGPLRYWSGGTGQTGLSVARPVGGCARWCMWLAQAQAAVYPVPPRSTPGATAYAGSASTATTLAVPVPATVTDARGAVYAQWISANTTTNARLIGFSGSATPAAVLSATSLQSWDGANLISLSGAWSASTASWFRGEWSDSAKSLTTPSASSSGAYDGAWLGSVVYVGSNAGTGDYINGLVSRTALCSRGGSACR